jgi:hypothetical protein
MKCFSEIFRVVAGRVIQAQPETDPNDDPQELFKQVRPLLNKLALGALTEASKTELMIGQTKGKNSLYCIQLRRTTSITPDTIDRIKRNEDNFDSIRWSSKAMQLYLWWPYETPAETPGAVPPPAPSA